MKKYLSLLLAGAMLFALAACGSSSSSAASEAESTPAAAESEVETLNTEPEATGEVTIEHDLGTTTLEVNPEKLAVYDLGILDILESVGIQVGAVPAASFPDYMSQYNDDTYVKVGGMKEVDFEALNEYSPDLVIISGRTSAAYEECAEIAPTVYMVNPGATYMVSMRENVEMLAQIFPAKAEALLARMAEIEQQAADLQAAGLASGLNALVLMANDGNLSVFGEGSRYGIIHDDFGFVAADDAVDSETTHGQEGSFEYIQSVNPDVIFVIDRSAAIGTEGASGAATLLDNDLVNSTTAAQEGRIVYLSSDIWYLVSGGFDSTEAMIAEVAAVLE